MFIVIRETMSDGDLMGYSIIGYFEKQEEAKKFVHKCINADIIGNTYREEGDYCIYDFRSIPRCYRYVIREVKLNETVCD